MEIETFWKINDFTKEVNNRSNSTVKKHYNTIASWFNRLEEKYLHYVNRVGENHEKSEKVYDTLDLRIALHIISRRDNKWSLDAIFDDLQNHFELRPFPEEYKRETTVVDIETVRREFMQSYEEVAHTVAEQVGKDILKVQEERIQAILNMQNDILNKLQKPVDPTEERQKRLTDIITQKRIEFILKEEALELWMKKPDSERLKKVGLFRKIENGEAREKFIQDYVHRYFEDRLRKEYDL